MKITTLISVLLISLASFSQGLNGEIALNDDYNQVSENVVVIDEFSYFIKQQSSSGFFTYCDLIKADTAGNIVWNTPITLQSVEYLRGMEIIPSENGGVYILGHARPGCDYGDDNFDFLQKYNASGALIWNRNFLDSDNYDNKMTGLSLGQNNELCISRSSPQESNIYTLNYDGIFLDTLNVNKTYLESIINFTGYSKIAHNGISIFGFDNNGNTISSVDFSSRVKDMEVLNDTLYALTSDSIFSFNTNFQTIESSTIAGYNGYSNLKVGNNKIEFVSQGVNDQFILTVNRQLAINDVLAIPAKIDADQPKDFNDIHFTTTINFNLTSYKSIRHLDFSRESTQDAVINSTDIGIVDIQQTQVSAIHNPGFEGIYTIKLWADVMIKNYGNKTLESCRINHKISPGVCGYTYYTEQFENLNLAPNDSMWVSLGFMHNNTYYFTDSTISLDICVYTSHPNSKTDLNVPNDNYCEEIIFGTLDLLENEIDEVKIYPNPASEFLNIELDKENLSYSIINMQGVLIDNGNVNAKQIDVSKLSSGMYVLQLSSKDGNLNYRKQFLKN
ncbi:T9SS type A sorting domain-containing protein [Brumimicrobium oceani]|nr:T9SS type A sorting domain-containing protein [Brumimicrobium oceani]